MLTLLVLWEEWGVEEWGWKEVVQRGGEGFEGLGGGEGFS